MSEIKKTCEKCKHCDCPPFIEPCSKCLSKAYNYKEFKALWEPKEDLKNDNLERVAKLIHENGIYGFSIPIPSDTVLKTERDHKIDHINERVDDIQANVLEYGNNCVSKLIELKEKVGLSPDADIYLHDIRQDLCDLDTKIDGLESMLKDIQESLNEIKGHEKLKTMTVVTQKKPIAKKSLYGLKIGDVVKYKGGNGALYTIVGFNERNRWYRLKSHSTSGYFVYIPGSRLEKVKEE